VTASGLTQITSIFSQLGFEYEPSTEIHKNTCSSFGAETYGGQEKVAHHYVYLEASSLLSEKCTIQNSGFVTVNTIQVKVIRKVIYISVDHDMFRLPLGHHHVYLCVLRCLIFVQIWIHIFFIFDRMIM
jgi:hypothetical protein